MSSSPWSDQVETELGRPVVFQIIENDPYSDESAIVETFTTEHKASLYLARLLRYRRRQGYGPDSSRWKIERYVLDPPIPNQWRRLDGS